jgi:hypothetical protein
MCHFGFRYSVDLCIDTDVSLNHIASIFKDKEYIQS